MPRATGSVNKTVILTSRENFVWLSMQEIIPWIERNWLRSAAPGRHQVSCLNVDETRLSALLPELLAADNVVFTCFTVKLCKLGELLRKRFGIEARYFIYLHNQATILCWPFHEWGMGAFFREDDVFISSSASDADTFSHSFLNARVEVVPFTIPGPRKEYRAAPANPHEMPFAYVGRLSAQKNLHTMLYAFRLFSGRNPAIRWKLRVFGEDDNLGSPNMGMSSLHYAKDLRSLCRVLGLEENVSFEGFCKRERIHRLLSRNRHIAVSASLHSDENFGMAPFRSLCRGNLAVLTRWGGFADFGKHFGDRAFLVPALETERGPWVDPAGFAGALCRAAEAYRRAKPGRVPVPDYYLEDRISAQLLAMAVERPRPGARLRKTPLAERILKKRDRYSRLAPGTSRIFESYSDPDAKIAFRGYGMKSAASASLRGGGKELRCMPWVRVAADRITIRDHHRGSFTLTHRGAGSRVLTDWFGGKSRIDRRTATRLLSLGYSHPLKVLVGSS